MSHTKKLTRHMLVGGPLLLIGSFVSYLGQTHNEILGTTCVEWAEMHLVCGSTMCSLPQTCPYLSTLTLLGMDFGYTYVGAELAFGLLGVVVGLAVILLAFKGQRSNRVPQSNSENGKRDVPRAQRSRWKSLITQSAKAAETEQKPKPAD